MQAIIATSPPAAPSCHLRVAAFSLNQRAAPPEDDVQPENQVHLWITEQKAKTFEHIQKKMQENWANQFICKAVGASRKHAMI